ncbi:hypothetical protein [Plantibacter sp. 2H11-2]|uniref:hypothetical protein n=1 Tax=Plantibacter sp. 2H11-2 TaxID=3414431 RepID=UPI003CE74D0B
MRTFLKTGGVLHIRGDEDCLPGKFIDVIVATAEDLPAAFTPSVLDPNNQVTASPLAAFRAILKTVGGSKPLSAPRQNLSLSVASDIRAFFGSVNIDNVHVNLGSVNEAEELSSLIDLLNREIELGRRFDDLLVIFRNCDQMEESLRRAFYYTIWEPSISHMVRLGARVVFQYKPVGFNTNSSSLPTMATSSINLPSELDGVVDEFAAVALDFAWERDLRDAQILANAILDTHPTVREVYDAMARLDLRERSTVE